MTYALKAADELAGLGIEAEVIDLRTLRPLDLDTVVESVKKTNRCVTVEEGWPVNSVGGHIASEIMVRRLRLARRAGAQGDAARTCRCPMRPTSRSWRCRRSPR